MNMPLHTFNCLDDAVAAAVQYTLEDEYSWCDIERIGSLLIFPAHPQQVQLVRAVWLVLRDDSRAGA